VVVAVSGALATLYFHPYVYDARGQLAHMERSVALAAAFAEAHRLSAHAFGVVAAAALILWRLSRRGGARWIWLSGVVLALAFFVTGHLVPWKRLLPWTPVPGSNLSRPVPLLGHDGPFAELVGVNMRYDDALFSVAGLRFGPRAAARVYWTHVAVLPLLSGALAILLVRRRRSAPRA
jgi:quinol-cytochrome oxidoreductase complex cytochrome b subunit